MPYVPFYRYLPGLAEMETRVITLPSAKNEFGLPAGEYAFVELFCDECDCRRAFFTVMNQSFKQPVAVITWGWESKAFYLKWFGSKDEDAIEEMMGSSLSMMSPQSGISPQVLKMFNALLLNNNDYTARVIKHYDLFRKALKKRDR